VTGSERAAASTGTAPVATAGGAAAPSARRPGAAPPPPGGGRIAGSWLSLAFLLPALILLASIVVYPTFYTVWRSLYDRAGDSFVGLDNYVDMFTSDATLTAIKNNALWVLVTPTVITALGLIFAVLTERIRWGTAFKLVVFMPMAISMLAAGIIFRLVYDADPDRGLANAIIVGVHDIFRPSAAYPGVRPRDTELLAAAPGGGFQTTQTFAPGETAELGLLAVKPEDLPSSAQNAQAPSEESGAITGTVWFDFTRGGGGEPNVIDPEEKGLPQVEVQAIRDGEVVESARANDAGQFSISGLDDGSYTLRLPESNFTAAFGGVTWLGETLATWSIMGSYVWIWAGFAMVLIAAGLAAIPRDALEAARVDGATEWQVFRRVTVPLLSPVLVVVIVTLMINVLKIFDIVFVLAPESVQDDANVIALEMWRVSFGGAQDHGLGSALAVFLFVLVLPAMIFNVRRFRREQR
jgi:alpha-glucoside transport system permease protein